MSSTPNIAALEKFASTVESVSSEMTLENPYRRVARVKSLTEKLNLAKSILGLCHTNLNDITREMNSIRNIIISQSTPSAMPADAVVALTKIYGRLSTCKSAYVKRVEILTLIIDSLSENISKAALAPQSMFRQESGKENDEPPVSSTLQNQVN
jgi:hypothetical protein